VYARALEETTVELRELRREEWWNLGLAALTFAVALGATQLLPALAVPLTVGGLAAAFLAARSFWRRWALVDRLLLDRDAYQIPDVRKRAERSATPENRHSLAKSIRFMLDQPSCASAARVHALAGELAALARDLDNAELSLTPACAVACERLLTDGSVSPLLNPALPADDTGARLRQIRAGFDRR